MELNLFLPTTTSPKIIKLQQIFHSVTEIRANSIYLEKKGLNKVDEQPVFYFNVGQYPIITE